MTEYIVTSRGDRVAYDRFGTGVGPAVIFVAGAGPFRAIDPVTTATAAALADSGVTAIVYDRLGRGESPADGPIDLDRELAAIGALLGVAGGGATLCGHSSGCSIALAAAASGLAVEGLVLWEAPLGPEDGGAREWAEEVTRRIRTGDLEGALAHYMKDMPAEFFAALRKSPVYPVLTAQAGSLQPDAESLSWAESAPLNVLLADIHVPVDVLLAEETLPIMEQAADAIVAALPGASQKRIRGAEHSWEAGAMAAELTRFVSSPSSV
jgi:pimeloyl-ACP methyl ester carboxylesterase